MNQYIDADLLEAKGKSYGLEFNIKKNKGKYTGQIAYTWSRSFIADITTFASEQVNGGSYYPSNYDRPSSLSIQGGVKLGDGWDFNCNFVYVSGRPATYPDGTYVINNTVVTNYSLRNEDRLPDYNRLDISFSHDSRRFPGQKRYTIFNFSIYNVYARKNPYSVYFQRDDSGLNSYELSIFNHYPFYHPLLLLLTAMIMRTIISFCIVLFFMPCPSCIRQITPPIRQSTPILVAEGVITTEPGPYTVKLSYTGRFTNASVRIDSNQNFINDAAMVVKKAMAIRLHAYSARQAYQSADSNFIRNSGHTYTLEIFLPNGKTYVSKPEKMNPVPGIDSISVSYDSTYVTDVRPTQLIISVNTPDPPGFRLYRWTASGYVPRKT